MAVDSSYAVYVVDDANHRIQQWLQNSASGTTVAGQANAVGGSGLNYLNYPSDIALDANGNMYILDGGNSRVLYWPVGASAGVLVAGNGTYTIISSRIKNLEFIVDRKLFFCTYV